MIVYRVCEEEEYIKIFSNKNFVDVGNYFDNKVTKNMNTHQYKKNIIYLHFFSNLDNVISYLNVFKGTYVCKYDIPDEMLKRCEGIGYYKDKYKFDSHEVIEYAIESSEIRFDYLKQVLFINSIVNISKICEGMELVDFGKMVYDLTNEPFDNQSHNILSNISIEDIISLLPKRQTEDNGIDDIFNKIVLYSKTKEENTRIKKLIK